MQNVTLESFEVIGIAIKTSNDDGKAAIDIPALWNRFLEENIQSKIPNIADPTIYGIYTDYEGDHTQPYTTIIGCRVSNSNQIPEGMVAKTIEGGAYAKFTERGDIYNDMIIKQWYRIWDMDLKRAYTSDLEVYGEKAMNPKDAEVDFLIAISE